ncbi:12740_t:CDS:1, partial [Gigaspora margarita]
LDNLAGPSYSSTLLPYNEDTTQVQFISYLSLSSSSFTTIRLDQPLSQSNTLPPN